MSQVTPLFESIFRVASPDIERSRYGSDTYGMNSIFESHHMIAAYLRVPPPFGQVVGQSVAIHGCPRGEHADGIC